MKKVLNIILTLMLGLSMVACSKSSLLKNSLQAGTGWGDVILNVENITIGGSLAIVKGDLDFTKSEVTIDGKIGTAGVLIKNIKSGSHEVKITVPAKDGSGYYSGTTTVAVNANALTQANVSISEAVVILNIYFKPSSAKSSVGLHTWGTHATGKAWPGVMMNDDGDGWYSYTLKGNSTAVLLEGIIFNWTGGQTKDLKTLPKSSGNIYYEEASSSWIQDKNSLTEFGSVILNESNISVGSLSIAKSDLDFSKSEVKIDGKTGKTGVAIEGLKLGSQTITLSVPSKDGKKVYSGSGTVTIEANKQVSASLTLSTEKSATNAYKIIFDPAAYGVTVVNEVHLVGIDDWNAANKSYPLVKQADGKWIGIFNITTGKEFKFMYDATSWDDGKHLGTDGDKNGPNFKVEEMVNVVEPVLAWKITFNPATYGVTVLNEVHLVGIADWNAANKSYSLVKQSDDKWIGYFDVSAGKEFKFMYDATSWDDGKHLGTDGDKNGPNFKVEETAGIITQNF